MHSHRVVSKPEYELVFSSQSGVRVAYVLPSQIPVFTVLAIALSLTWEGFRSQANECGCVLSPPPPLLLGYPRLPP